MANKTSPALIRSALKWGATHTTGMAPSEASAIIQEVATEHGMRIESVTQSNGFILIQARQTAPWYRILLQALPQASFWVLRRDGGRTFITHDIKQFPWYAAFLAAFYAMTGVFGIVSWDALLHVPPPTESCSLLWTAVRFLFSISMLFALFHICKAGDSRPVWVWMQALERRFESHASFLYKVGRAFAKRSMGRYLLFSLFFLILVVLFLIQGFTATPNIHVLFGKSHGFNFALAAFCSIPITMLCALVLLELGNPSMSTRAIPMWDGMNTMLFALFVMTSSCLWIVTMPQANTIADLTQMMETKLLQKQPSIVSSYVRSHVLTSKERIQCQNAVSWYRNEARIFFLFIAAMIAIGGGIALGGIHRTLAYWHWLQRLRTQPNVKDVRRAIAGKGFLALYRWIFVTLWASLSICVWAGLVFYAAACFAPVRVPARTLPNAACGLLDASVAMLSVALNRPPLVLLPVVFLGWLVFTTLCVGPFLLSVSEWLRTRSRRLKMMRKNAAKPLLDLAEWQGTLRVLAAKAGCPPPTLAITPDFIPFARSLLLGWSNRRLFIEVSSRCFRILDPAEIKALLAHELAHHALRHCARDNLIQFLGRITLVGDGFTRALQDSFGYEIAADRFAIERLGADPKALESCLRKLEKEHMEGQAPATMLTAFAAIGIPTTDYKRVFDEGPKTLRWTARWRLAWRMFLDQHTGRVNTAYWHPAIQDRINALSTMNT